MMAMNTLDAAPAASVTGRDNYITLKAMLYAIATIQALPEETREYGDLCDMQALARAGWLAMASRDAVHDVPVLLCHAMLEVHYHTKQMPDLWPNDFGDEMSEIYEPHELALKDAVCVTIDNLVTLAKFNRDNGLGRAA